MKAKLIHLLHVPSTWYDSRHDSTLPKKCISKPNNQTLILTSSSRLGFWKKRKRSLWKFVHHNQATESTHCPTTHTVNIETRVINYIADVFRIFIFLCIQNEICMKHTAGLQLGKSQKIYTAYFPPCLCCLSILIL